MLVVHKNPSLKGFQNTVIEERVYGSPPWSPPSKQTDPEPENPPGLTFSWANFSHDPKSDDGSASGSASPRLWGPEFNLTEAVSLRAEEMARARQEMLKFYEGMPESAYELSLRDLIEQKESPKLKQKQNESPRKMAKVKKAGKGSGSGQSRNKDQSQTQRRILLNIFLPGKGTGTGSFSACSCPFRGAAAQQSAQTPKESSAEKFPESVSEKANSPTLSSSRNSWQYLLTHRRSSKGSSPETELSPSNGSPYARSNTNGRSKSSNNRCYLCSGYTLFFKTKCQACGKIYCSNCDKTAVKNTPAGPRCHDSCALRSKSEREFEPSLKHCWPAFSAANVVKFSRKSRNSSTKDESQ